MNDGIKTVMAYAIMLALLALMLSVFCFRAKMESSTYNRLTGAHTTMWDAMWVELRVQDNSKSNQP